MKERFNFEEVTAQFYSPHQISLLRKVKIGIAGAGGIGSNCTVMLVRSGFSQFIVADFDRVTASNLNRQAYTVTHLDRIKVECLKRICREINPAITMKSYDRRIDKNNIHEIFDSCDVIIEAFDDAASKALLFSEYPHSEKLLVGVSGIAGIGNSESITIRNVGKNCYIVGDHVSAVGPTLKPHAPRVTVAAAKMADIVLSWALEQ